MSDPKSSDHEALEFTDLEPMAAPDAASGEAAEAGGDAAEPVRTAAEAGGVQLRELDKAPRHLRTASLIVVAGSLFPWMGHGGGWMTAALAKVVVLLGVACLYAYWKYRGGEAVAGALGKLAEIALVPKKKDDGKKKRRKRGDAAPDLSLVLRGAPFPTALHLVGLLAIVGGVLLPLLEEGTDVGKAAAELGMLAWGAATWVHIYSYERGHKFSPIFPLMFLGHALAGILSAVKGFGAGALLEAVGGLVVGVGGIFAAYTIIEALKQAKTEGDKKKAAAAEARREARRARGTAN